MTIIKIWILLNMFLFSVALVGAQEQQASPRERAMLERIRSEVNGNMYCSELVEVLRDRVRDLEAKLKATETEKKD